jgi:hypothetical protein
MGRGVADRTAIRLALRIATSPATRTCRAVARLIADNILMTSIGVLMCNSQWIRYADCDTNARALQKEEAARL